ncbi:MAG: hypothetical protein IKG30_12800 [Clostridiales bacterium]|nr:hypothetical protein [Clostridiales bacterium]
MKCANCGNTDHRTLIDEGDTYYCSICCHRTLVATGKDDLITCPFCRRLRDRKAAYCMWCNIPINAQSDFSEKELKDLDAQIKRFEDKLDSSNIRFWKLKDKRGEI